MRHEVSVKQMRVDTVTEVVHESSKNDILFVLFFYKDGGVSSSILETIIF